MSEPHVVVVGGGLAGIAAALACADAGARVNLLEARPRLGGATWSSQRDGLWIDNGQHVFLRCCTAYREFVRRLGVEEKLRLQSRLALPVIAPGGRTHWLRRAGLPVPLHLAASLARFAHLGAAQRMRIARTVWRIGRLDLEDPALDERSFGAWLAEQGECEASIARFWDLLIRPTVNVSAADASLALATKVFQTGLLEAAGNADIGWSRVPLQELHGDAGARALEQAGVALRLRARVTSVELSSQGARVACADGTRVAGDALILAAPHEATAALLPAAAGLNAGDLRKLGRSPIVNLHVVYDRRVTDFELAAGIGSPVEWIFDRSASAGLEAGQYLAITLSAADAYTGVRVEELRRRFLPEIARLLPRARAARVLRFLVTCEPAATFHQLPGTRRARPGARTSAPGLYLAGAWTDTGWPATMESAVRSGRAAAGCALRDAGRTRGLPAEAA
ncbi:MAG: hydroxysqualene dehydroxylase HpnE [Myxococcales bacterium]|nr:hydroxysqualene dehydroxylase HpnE [Myxococcales bacterium]MDH5307033.1 hydroxysqualene dehydroxylase HpnE [Myxococcales bacterium]MDH5565732.1 hydroxysqualene dehydroxylase HpnE [Myxococcales bacterium]